MFSHIRQKEPDVKLMLLKNTANNYELGVVEGLLENNQIPYIIQDKGVDSMRIYVGSSIYGTDVLVAEWDFEKAKAILEQIDWEGTEITK